MHDSSYLTFITDEECTLHATLTAYYQLAQSVLKIGFVQKKVGYGEVGRHGMHMVAVWVAVGKCWLSLPGGYFSSLAQNGIGTGPLTL